MIISSGSVLALSNFFTSICQSLLKGALTGSSASLQRTFSVQHSFLVPCPVKPNHLGLPGLAAPSPQFRENAGGRLGPPPWTIPTRERILQITTCFLSFKHYGLSFLGFLVVFFFTFLITDLFIYFLNSLLLEYSQLTML